MMFEIDEVINPEDWGLRIKITSLEPLEAVVVKSETQYPSKWGKKYFPIGRVLRFQRVPDQDSWTIVSDDKDEPWFILGIYEGRKRFEHYR
jgi:hypothetical protein